MKTFAQLLAGRTDCYGTYRLNSARKERSDGKKEGRGVSKSEPVTDELWQAHLAGKQMLGIVPILPDSTCSWFALDIDDYTIDQAELGKRIREMELPVVQCRSKSGGTHLYCFLSAPVPAKLARDVAKRWIDRLNYKKYDLFPKQDKVAPDSQGNWINLPYFGGDNAENYAFGINDEKLTLDEFVQMANAMTVTPEELSKHLEIKKEPVKKQLKDQAPPCVQKFLEDGVASDRNITLGHMAVFYKKVDEANWKELLTKFNFEYCQPPVDYEELNQIIKNASAKNYAYFCSQGPMPSLCNKELCKTRKYGVGIDKARYGDYSIEELIKMDSDPPIYLVRINGKQVKMSTDELINPRLFRKRVMEICNVLIPAFKQHDHDLIITPIIHEAMIIEAAPEVASLEGQVIGVFREWCKAFISRCPNRDDVAKGNPYYDIKGNQIIFRGEDLMKQYRINYRRDVPMKDLWSVLRNNMCEAKPTRIKNEVVRAWHFPMEGEEVWFEVPKDHDQF